MSRGPLLAPGYRTEVRRDWRAGAAAAVAAVTGDPGSWLLGLAGFLTRGGAVVLALPLLSIPSPVLLSLLFRGEVGVIGRGEIRVLAIGVGLVLAGVAILAVIVSAWADLALAERLVHDTETDELRLRRAARRLAPGERRSLLWWVASVQALALVPIIIVVTIALDAAARVAANELRNPSAVDRTLAERVLPAIGGELALVVVIVLLTEAGSSLASRRLMVSAWGLLPHGPARPPGSRVALGALGRLVRQPARVLRTGAAGWAIMVLAIVLTVVVTALTWGTARDVLVSGAAASGSAAMVVAAFLVALTTAVWLGGLGLVGYASAVRSGLWTADALR